MVYQFYEVLNLIINGLPSILIQDIQNIRTQQRFKPYYKWITFNTGAGCYYVYKGVKGFKPYYKWITFNTL